MKTIIIIDDEQAICDAIRLIFGFDGYRVQSFPTGKALLNHEFDPPDVFILDYQLADMNGLELCKVLKHRDNTKTIPVIMISATPSIAPLLLKGGADFFLEKPFNMDDILGIVKRFTWHGPRVAE